MAAGGWRWTWPVAGSAGAGRTRSVARSPGRWRRCTRAACACTCWPRMRRATSGCRRWPESERPARERCRAAAARRARAAGAAMVAAGAWLVGAGRGRAAAGCGLGPVALAQGAPPTPGRTPVRRHRRGSGEPGGAGGGDFGPAAAGGAPDRTGCGYARRRGLARRARPRPAAGRLCPGPGRAAARRRLPPHGRCAGARSAAHACTPAFHRLDAASMSAAVLADIAALVPGFAWPWLLLAVPLPWLVRWLLPPVRSALPALRVPWGGRLDAIAHGGGAPDVLRLPWLAGLAPAVRGRRAAAGAWRGGATAGVRARPDAGRRPVGQHGRGGHARGRAHGRPPHRRQGGAGRLPRPPRRGPCGPDRVRPARL